MSEEQVVHNQGSQTAPVSISRWATWEAGLAYFTLMASVVEAEVDALRQDPSLVLHPSLVSGASHLLSYWVKVQPLGQLLNEAVDGGELLHDELWHPLRPPMFHRPPKVRWLADQVEAACEGVKTEFPQDDDAWLVAEVNRLLCLYLHAAAAGECVVTALDLPGDEECARRVRIPWKASSTTEKSKLRWKFW